MANHDRSLVPVPSYLRDLYQLITLLLSDRKVAGIADFRALSEVNHEAEVNRLLIWIATATRQFLDMATGSCTPASPRISTAARPNIGATKGGSAATSHRSASAPRRRRRESGSKISDARANQPARNDNSPPAAPNPTCRMPSSARPAILRRGRRRTPVGQPCAP